MSKISSVGIAAALGFACSVAPSAAWADRAEHPAHQSFELGDYPVEGGGTIRGAQLTYVTHGTLNAEKTNAVLVLPSYAGNHHRHDFLIGPGRALDPARYFIIAVDTFGNGRASSPSNSKAQPGPDFPRFSIRDMVGAQRRLVTERFGIKRLLAVGGLSMGGMQSYQWAVSYPDDVAAAFPIVAMSRYTPWQTVVWEGVRRSIQADAAWNGGRYEANPEKGVGAAATVIAGIGRHWGWFNQEFSAKGPQALSAFLEANANAFAKGNDANNMIYQTWALESHDVGKAAPFNGDTAAALSSIKAKVLLMPADTDLLHPAQDSRDAVGKIPKGRLVEIVSTAGHNGGGGLRPSDADMMNGVIGQFLAQVMQEEQGR
jgi:homoserine O-acetyltransferase